MNGFYYEFYACYYLIDPDAFRIDLTSIEEGTSISISRWSASALLYNIFPLAVEAVVGIRCYWITLKFAAAAAAEELGGNFRGKVIDF